jgi:site-specific DNA-methyltransferase (adenine-specific)
MQPYYDHAGITIFLGDCRDILPTLGPVDLVLTDPPYGINLDTDNRRFSGGHNLQRRERPGSAWAEPVRNDDRPFDPSFLLDYGKHQIIWGWNNYPDRLPRGACLVWLKRYDEAFGTFLSDAELAWMSKGHGVYCRRDLSNQGVSRERVHPTQKPVSLMRWCMSFFPDARTILDPFGGSGTTALAAKMLGRSCIMVEIEERYCDQAARRLSQEVFDFEAASTNPIG